MQVQNINNQISMKNNQPSFGITIHTTPQFNRDVVELGLSKKVFKSLVKSNKIFAESGDIVIVDSGRTISRNSFPHVEFGVPNKLRDDGIFESIKEIVTGSNEIKSLGNYIEELNQKYGVDLYVRIKNGETFVTNKIDRFKGKLAIVADFLSTRPKKEYSAAVDVINGDIIPGNSINLKEKDNSYLGHLFLKNAPEFFSINDIFDFSYDPFNPNKFRKQLDKAFLFVKREGKSYLEQKLIIQAKNNKLAAPMDAFKHQLNDAGITQAGRLFRELGGPFDF